MLEFNAIFDLVLGTIISAGVGFVSGLFGVGGSFLLVPILSFVMFLPMPIVVGSSACQVLGPATTAILARGIRRIEPRIPLILFGGLLTGVYLGAGLLEWAKQREMAEAETSVIVTADFLVLAVYFITLASLGVFVLLETSSKPDGQAETQTSWFQKLRLPPYIHVAGEQGDSSVSVIVSIPALSWFGLCVGFLSGLLGISGGLVVMPGLVYLFGIPTRTAIRISMATVWVIAVQSTVIHALHENIDLGLVCCLMVGGTIGARIGAEFGGRITGRNLRRWFGWLILATSVFVGIRFVAMMF